MERRLSEAFALVDITLILPIVDLFARTPGVNAGGCEFGVQALALPDPPPLPEVYPGALPLGFHVDVWIRGIVRRFFVGSLEPQLLCAPFDFDGRRRPRVFQLQLSQPFFKLS